MILVDNYPSARAEACGFQESSMTEDMLLIWQLKRGSSRALQRIYEKYESYLLTVAMTLLSDLAGAEDVVHDFFVSLAQSADKLSLAGSLKAYMAICVANRARDVLRKKRDCVSVREKEIQGTDWPELAVIKDEQIRAAGRAIKELPYEQKEAVVLHLQGELKFKDIARLQNVSINTVQSRYRYGIDKLRSLLNSELAK